MKVIRVFPRRTRATPDDEFAVVDSPPGIFHDADEVHISVSFTWDIPRAEWLEKQWRHVGRTSVGGPAFMTPSAEFVPGMYLKPGYTITSRGCPNKCWFCSVHRREPKLIELFVQPGWNILDDNLLACSREHIESVFSMLSKYGKRKAEFTGGLDPRFMNAWVAGKLYSIRPYGMFFAYDTPDDLEPLRESAKLLQGAGFKYGDTHNIRCYVLCGYPKDTMDKAEARMRQVLEVGMTPMAMLWRGQDGKYNPTWRRFQRTWVRPAIIYGHKHELRQKDTTPLLV